MHAYIFYCRYRAIIHPLRRAPGKLFTLAVIAVIWLLSLGFALPMGFLHTFGYVPDPSTGYKVGLYFASIKNSLLTYSHVLLTKKTRRGLFTLERTALH